MTARVFRSMVAAALATSCLVPCLTSSGVAMAQAPPVKPATKGPAVEKAWVSPLERPAVFKDKPFLTDAEVADYERRTADRADGRQLEDPRTDPSVQAPAWLDYGKRMVGSNRSSLIVDPPDGRIPPLTADGQKRDADRRSANRTHGPADGPENRRSRGKLRHE